MNRERSIPPRIKITFLDNGNRKIATYDTDMEGSLERTYGCLVVAYEGGQLSEGRFLQYRRDLIKLGMEPTQEDRAKFAPVEQLINEITRQSKEENPR